MTKTALYHDVIVMGAGIAGLVAGFRAKAQGRDVLILESRPRSGGLIQSIRKEGFLWEAGPNTVTPTPELMSLVEVLHLKEDLLLADPKTPRFIHTNNQLIPVPLSPPALAKTPLLRLSAKARLLTEPLRKKRRDFRDESVADFVRRRLGSDVCEHLLKPFVSGVWAGDAETLSALSSFPKLKQWEERHGSLIKGALKSQKEKKEDPSTAPKGLMSFRHGLGQLPEALTRDLVGSVKFNHAVVEIEKDKEWFVRTEQAAFRCSTLISTLPSHKAAPLFTPLSPKAEVLTQIPYAPLVQVFVTFPKEAPSHSLQGFGYLNTPKEKRPVLGCLFSSSLFPERAPASARLLTLFLGGALNPDLIEKSDLELTQLVFEELKQSIGLKDPPLLLDVRRYLHAIPQYTIGHHHREEAIADIEKSLPGLRFAGNYRGGVAVGDVIRNAWNL